MSKAKYYEIEIAGLKRQLTLCKIGENISIAAFIMFNDVELTIKSAKELLAKSPEFDIIITAESKSIPLAYEMARQSEKPYYVARKGEKLYMSNPKKMAVQSITTKNEQTLVMDGPEVEQMAGKRILLVDDVISTGETLRVMESFVNVAGATVVGKAAVLAEGDAIDREDITYLAPLPLFEG